MLDDDLYRLVVRARNRWRKSPGHVDERFCDEFTGQPNDNCFFMPTSDHPGVRGYENDPVVKPASESPDKNYQP